MNNLSAKFETKRLLATVIAIMLAVVLFVTATVLFVKDVNNSVSTAYAEEAAASPTSEGGASARAGVVNIGGREDFDFEGSTLLGLSNVAYKKLGVADSYLTSERTRAQKNYAIPSGTQFTVTIPSGYNRITDDDGGVVEEAIVIASIAQNAFQRIRYMTAITLPFVGGYAAPNPNSTESLFGYIFGDSDGVGGTTDIVQLYKASASATSPTSASAGIPTALKSVTITGGVISYGALSGLTPVESITINGVSAIGDMAFQGCSSLKNVNLSSSTRTIGEDAFQYCSALQEINIPNGVTTIGARAFRNLAYLTRITVPNTLTTIGADAFENAGNQQSRIVVKVSGMSGVNNWAKINFADPESNPMYLGKVALCDVADTKDDPTPYSAITLNSATTISNYAFRNYTYLESVNITASITSIGINAFDGCSALTRVTCTGSATTEGSLTLPNSIATIGANAFMNCVGITNVKIPSTNLSDMGNAMFRGCINITEMEIPYAGQYEASGNRYFGWIFGTTNYSGSYAANQNGTTFYIPSSLAKLTITGKGGTALYTYALQNLNSLTDIVIKGGVTTNGQYLMNGTSKLVNLEIPFVGGNDTDANVFNYVFNGIPATLRKVVITGGHMPNNAFTDASGITDITLPNTITSIGNSAFSGCTNLKSLSLKSGVTAIGDSAFVNCQNMTFIDIPATVTSVASNAFNNTYRLADINITNLDKWAEISFANTVANPLYYVDNTSYVAKERHLNLNGDLVEDAKLQAATVIRPYAFYMYKALKKVTIPNTVTNVGTYAFHDCSNLTTVEFAQTGSAALVISDYAFNMCKNPNFNTVVVPNRTTTMGVGVFANCDYLTTLSIPFVGTTRTGTNSQSYAFGYIFSPHNAAASSYPGVAAGTLTTVSQIYHSNNSTATYHIPSGLANVAITDDQEMNYGAFINCRMIKNLTINTNKLSTIHSRAFENTDLETVYITDVAKYCAVTFEAPTSVPTYYGKANWVDSAGKNITSLTIPGSVSKIMPYAFYNCPTFQEVTIHQGIVNTYAFYGNKNLVTLDLDGVTQLDNYAFAACTSLMGSSRKAGSGNIVTLCIPVSMKTIGSYAFQNCTAITGVMMAERGYDTESLNALTTAHLTINASAFVGCSALECVDVADGEQYAWGRITFGNAEANPLHVARHLYTYNNVDEVRKEVSTLTIRPSQTYLNYAFYNCISFTTITIMPNAGDVANGSYTFYNCTGIAYVYNNAGKNISVGSTNYGCVAYTARQVLTTGQQPSSLSYGNFVFVRVNSTTLEMQGFTSSFNSAGRDIVLPNIAALNINGDGTLGLPYARMDKTNPEGNYDGEIYTTYTIKANAFYGQAFVSVSIPACVSAIGSAAFGGCESLETITVPYVGQDINSTRILGHIFGTTRNPGDYAAQRESSTTYYVPSSLKTVIVTGGSAMDTGAFSRFTSLETVILPDNANTIPANAFLGCTGLKTIRLLGDKTGATSWAINANAFSGATNITDVFTGLSLSQWAGRVTVNNAYASPMNGQKARLWTSATAAANDATSFSGTAVNANALKTMDIDALSSTTTKAIQQYAFWGYDFFASQSNNGSSSNKDLVIPTGVTHVYEGAFGGNKMLASIDVPFVGNCAVTAVSNNRVYSFGYIFGTISSAGHYAAGQTNATYYFPTTLTTVTVRNGATINYYAFQNCNKIETINLPDNLQASSLSIGQYAFDGC
ncbi:MAG: leucine-rich repeat domain-containing protein, partial [Corallococcus sp.]|nr:leucine-rich repeat domain-containing protein [Corallococcus sp.]